MTLVEKERMMRENDQTQRNELPKPITNVPLMSTSQTMPSLLQPTMFTNPVRTPMNFSSSTSTATDLTSSLMKNLTSFTPRPSMTMSNITSMNSGIGGLMKPKSAAAELDDLLN